MLEGDTLIALGERDTLKGDTGVHIEVVGGDIETGVGKERDVGIVGNTEEDT